MDINLPAEPTREARLTEKDVYTRDEVAKLISDAIRQTVIEERRYLLALLEDMNQRDALAAMPPPRWIN